MAVVGGIMVPHPPLIVPEVGRGEEDIIKTTTDAYKEAARHVAALQPETIVLTSPHSILYGDYFHISPGREASGSLKQFNAPFAKYHVTYDTEFVDALCVRAQNAFFPAGTEGEREKSLDHGTMVPLSFINREYTSYRLVRIGLSGLSLSDHYRLGRMIAQTAKELNRRTVFVASGDLSHKLQPHGPYGFAPEGPAYDARIMEVMGSGDFLALFDFDEHFLEKAAECGHRSFVIMAGAFDRKRLDIKKLSHEDVTGVGYGVCTYTVTGEDASRDFMTQWEDEQDRLMEEKRANEDAYVRLARNSLEAFVMRNEEIAVPFDTPKELLTHRAGAFVSLHKDGRLRGCIGTIGPVQDNIAKEIINNAISACSADPRFSPVTVDELSSIEISVDILGETEPVDSPGQLDVKRYGVIVTKGHRRGLLLPNLDGVDSVEEQLLIAKQKAGIAPDEQGVTLERFEVVRHY